MSGHLSLTHMFLFSFLFIQSRCLTTFDFTITSSHTSPQLLAKRKNKKMGKGADREPYVSNMSYSFHFLSERAIGG